MATDSKVIEPIIKVSTIDAVKSIGELRENIKILKKQLNEVQIDSAEGWKDYQDKLEELKINQNALKDAMYATTSSFEDVVKSASSAGIAFGEDNKLINRETLSYNALVHEMANLKETWRSTSDEVTRANIGEQIKDVNDRLKELDSTIGNHQREVGHYENALKGLHGVVKDLPSNLGFLKGSLDDVDKTMGMISKNKIIGTMFLLAPLINNIAMALKENETALGAIKKLMESLQPIFDLMSKAVETLAIWFSKAVNWVIELAGESGDTFKNIISGAFGVGNSLKEFLLTPIRQTIEAVKGLSNVFKDLFKGDFASVKEDAKNAVKGINDAFTKGFSFKENFKVGKEVGEAFVAGLGSTKDSVKTTLKDAVQEAVDEVVNDLSVENIMKTIEKVEKALDAERKMRLEEQKEIDAMTEQQTAELTADIDAMFEEMHQRELERMEEEQKKAEETAQARIDTMYALASASSSILGSIADLYENDAKNNQRSANKVKAVRIASATIDTISGALGAFTQATETIPPPYGQIVGAANSAAITATGLAQIAKIKSTNVSSSGGASVGASVSAPSVPMEMPMSRNITSASEEDRLNRMASDQRVKLVMSDLEVAEEQIRVQTEESSF